MQFTETVWPWAVVEISGHATPEDQSGLIHAAYRASRSGVIALALRGITPDAVDRVLDGLVNPVDGSIKGVVYLDGDEMGSLRPALRRAGVVIASTAGFRSQLLEMGIRAMDADAETPQRALDRLGAAAGSGAERIVA